MTCTCCFLSRAPNYQITQNTACSVALHDKRKKNHEGQKKSDMNERTRLKKRIERTCSPGSCRSYRGREGGIRRVIILLAFGQNYRPALTRPVHGQKRNKNSWDPAGPRGTVHPTSFLIFQLFPIPSRNIFLNSPGFTSIRYDTIRYNRKWRFHDDVTLVEM